jgi:hypothetical protein
MRGELPRERLFLGLHLLAQRHLPSFLGGDGVVIIEERFEEAVAFEEVVGLALGSGVDSEEVSLEEARKGKNKGGGGRGRDYEYDDWR